MTPVADNGSRCVKCQDKDEDPVISFKEMMDAEMKTFNRDLLEKHMGNSIILELSSVTSKTTRKFMYGSQDLYYGEHKCIWSPVKF